MKTEETAEGSKEMQRRGGGSVGGREKGSKGEREGLVPCLLSLLTRRGCCCLTHDRNKTMFSEAGEHQEVFASKQQKRAGRIREREGGGSSSLSDYLFWSE